MGILLCPGPLSNGIEHLVQEAEFTFRWPEQINESLMDPGREKASLLGDWVGWNVAHSFVESEDKYGRCISATVTVSGSYTCP